MTAQEIINKWIGEAFSSDDRAIKEAAAAITAGMREDIEAAVETGKEEEREACAKIAEEEAKTAFHPGQENSAFLYINASIIVNRIRARSK